MYFTVNEVIIRRKWVEYIRKLERELENERDIYLLLCLVLVAVLTDIRREDLQQLVARARLLEFCNIKTQAVEGHHKQ